MGSIPQPQQAFRRRAPAASALAVVAALLAGCTAASVADRMPTAVGGLPADAPQRPTTPADYPAVHDVPPKRDNTMLSDAEQKKLEDDLAAARKKAAGAAGAPAKPAGSAPSP